jgi:zinc transport system permease protein
MSLLDDFLLRAALAGVGTALAAAPLGCFVVWRRMAYFGDATAHAAILGVAFSLALGLPIALGVLVAALAMAGALTRLAHPTLGADATLAVLAYSALAVGLVAVSLTGGVRIDLEAYLFGDILAVTQGDLALIWGGAALIAGLLAWRWQGLLTATLDPDLARAAGVDPRREEAVLTLATAILVALSIKVVGALLIVSLLIIPAAAARPFARTPEGMALTAAAIGALAAIAGLGLSLEADTPTGPSIVAAAALAFALSTLMRRRTA